MAPRHNIYTINQAVDQANRDRRENEARADRQWQQMRRDASAQSFQREQRQFVQSSLDRCQAFNEAREFSHASAPGSYAPKKTGSGIGATFGFILALVICGYALAHGVALGAIIKTGFLIAAAAVVIAIALGVIAFIRAFAGPIIVIGLIGWGLWVSHHAPAAPPASGDHAQARLAPAAASPAPQPATRPSGESDAHLRYQGEHVQEWVKELGPDRVKQIVDGLPKKDLSTVPELMNRLESAAASLHQ